MTDGRRTAILIAASEFPEEPSLQSLRCPKNDVAGLAEALTSPDFGLFTDPLTFINEPSHSTLRAVNRVFKEAGRDDQILIYYSGHGKQDGAGNLYLATSDTEADTLETSSIAVGTLRRLIDNYACKQVALILDCCFGGAVSKDFLKGGVDDHLKQTFHGRGIYILTASTATQTAREKEGDDYSLFTKHIIQGIRQGEADHDDDGLISLDDLYEYVKTRVPKEAPQYPTKWEFGVQGNSLFIARAARTFSPERLRAFREKIKSVDDYLLPDVFDQAYKVIRENQPKRDKEFFDLLEALCEERMTIGEFSSRWLDLAPASKLEREKNAPPPRQENKAQTPTLVIMTPPQEEKAPLSLRTINWRLLMVRGLFAMLFGIALFLWTGGRYMVALPFGIYALVDGIFALSAAFITRDIERQHQMSIFFKGLVGIAVSAMIFMLWNYFIGLNELIIFWAIVTGCFEAVTTIKLRREVRGEWMMALISILSIFFGLIMVAPALSQGEFLDNWIYVLMAYALMAYALAIGALMIALSFKLRALTSWRIHHQSIER